MANAKLAEALASMEEALAATGRAKDEADDMRTAAKDAADYADNTQDEVSNTVTEIEQAIAILGDAIKDMGDDEISRAELSTLVEDQYSEIDSALDSLQASRRKLERFAILHELDVSWREPVLPSEAPDAG